VKGVCAAKSTACATPYQSAGAAAPNIIPPPQCLE
jgi:hypothetical protein